MPAHDEDRLAGAGLLGLLGRQRAGEQLAERWVTALALGQLSPGERLPNERELAVRLQTSRTTVADAVRLLELQGAVELRRGRLRVRLPVMVHVLDHFCFSPGRHHDDRPVG